MQNMQILYLVSRVLREILVFLHSVAAEVLRRRVLSTRTVFHWCPLDAHQYLHLAFQGAKRKSLEGMFKWTGSGSSQWDRYMGSCESRIKYSKGPPARQNIRLRMLPVTVLEILSILPPMLCNLFLSVTYPDAFPGLG